MSLGAGAPRGGDATKGECRRPPKAGGNEAQLKEAA